MSAGAINSLIGNLIGAANGIAFVALLAALLLPVYYRKGAVTGSSLTLLVCTQLIYFLIATLSLGESSGMGRANPALISTLYLVGAILFVFFFYAHDRNLTISQLKDSIGGHQSATSTLSTQSGILHSYLNALPYPLLAVNAENTVVFSNIAFIKTFMPEQHWGSSAVLRTGDLPTPVQSILARCSFQEVVAMGSAVTRVIALPAMGRNGRVFHLNAVPLFVDSGLASLVLYSLYDITQETQMYEALMEERDACSLKTHNARLTHEFSNVFAGISGIAQLLAGESAEDSETAKYIRQTLELADRGDTLLREMTSEEAQAFSGEELDLAELLETGQEEIEKALPDGIKLRLNIAAGRPYKTRGEKEKVLYAVTALAANAGEASLPGGTVVLSLSPVQVNGKDMLRVALIDSGRGIPPEDNERVFAPFFTTKEGHKGMGLPIAISIAATHRGMLRLERSDELGTEFALYLPAMKS